MSFEKTRRPSRGVGTGPSQDGTKSGGRGTWIVLSLAILFGCAAIYWATHRSSSPSERDAAEAQQSGAPKASSTVADAPGGSSTRPRLASRVRLSSSGTPADVAEPIVAAPVAPAGLNLPRNAQTVAAAGIIDQLFQLGSSTNTPITAAQSEQISAQLRELMNMGTPAVAAIYDFLQKDTDLTFGKSTLAGGTGAFSLRTGLIDALTRIGGKEAISVAADTLQHTAVPGEITSLARMLDQQAPGEYNQLAVAASREALRAAAKEPSTEVEVAPLFQILQKYGDSSVVSDFQNLSTQFPYYSLIALGGMPDGQGVPALVEVASGPITQATGYQQVVALRMLAQTAPTSPEAQKVIVEMASQGRIPNWDEVAPALAGTRLQYVHEAFPQTGATTGQPNRITQTHHVAHGNQNYQTHYAAIPEAQIPQHRAFIDQLIGVTTDPVGRAALQKARDSLSGVSN